MRISVSGDLSNTVDRASRISAPHRQSGRLCDPAADTRSSLDITHSLIEACFVPVLSGISNENSVFVNSSTASGWRVNGDVNDVMKCAKGDG